MSPRAGANARLMKYRDGSVIEMHPVGTDIRRLWRELATVVGNQQLEIVDVANGIAAFAGFWSMLNYLC